MVLIGSMFRGENEAPLQPGDFFSSIPRHEPDDADIQAALFSRVEAIGSANRQRIRGA